MEKTITVTAKNIKIDIDNSTDYKDFILERDDTRITILIDMTEKEITINNTVLSPFQSLLLKQFINQL